MAKFGAIAVTVIILYFVLMSCGEKMHDEFGAEPGASYCIRYDLYVYRCD